MKTIKHAFLIDDDAVINMINIKVIEFSKLASKVTSVTNAKEALDMLTKIGVSDSDTFPEIIFLDINMPDMDGWDFLNVFIKFPDSLLEKCRIIMLTSSIDLFDIKKAKTYPIVSDYIVKPLNAKLLSILSSPRHQYFSISQNAVQEIR